MDWAPQNCSILAECSKRLLELPFVVRRLSRRVPSVELPTSRVKDSAVNVPRRWRTAVPKVAQIIRRATDSPVTVVEPSWSAAAPLFNPRAELRGEL